MGFSGWRMFKPSPPMLGIYCHEMRFENLKCVRMRLRPGSAADPAGGAYSALHRAIFKGKGLIGSNPSQNCWEFVATRCVLRVVYASKCIYGWGFAPDIAVEAFSVPQTNLLAAWTFVACLSRSFKLTLSCEKSVYRPVRIKSPCTVFARSSFVDAHGQWNSKPRSAGLVRLGGRLLPGAEGPVV